jgi:LmbE family N-acetylglucosaminyl deacetylase
MMSIDATQGDLPGGLVLIVAAHPDDEILGCGGIVARHAAAGDRVETLILAEGATARQQTRDTSGGAAEINALRDAAWAAAKVLGSEPPQFASLPDNRMDSLTLLDIVKHVEATVERLQPRFVYTHHGGDLNVDHRLTHQAVITACRPLPGAPVRGIYSFETASSTEWGSTGIDPGFRPTRFVDISDFIALKLQALDCYEAEMRPFPHARSNEAIEARARVRGAEIGVFAAEAFEVIREIM